MVRESVNFQKNPELRKKIWKPKIIFFFLNLANKPIYSSYLQKVFFESGYLIPFAFESKTADVH